MQELELEAIPRSVLGKKVRQLRRAGIIPMNLYGRGMPSVALQAPTRELERVVAAAGHSRLINLLYSGKKRLVLARQAQRDARTHHLTHVDLYAVPLTERIRLSVPIVLVGESPAVNEKDAVLVHPLAQVEIEALATDIPQNIQVDLSSLVEVDDAIHVRDLTPPTGVTFLSDLDEVVAKAAAQRVAEAVEEAEAAAAEAAPAAPKAAEQTSGG